MNSASCHVVVVLHSLGSRGRRDVVLRLPSQGIMFTLGKQNLRRERFILAIICMRYYHAEGILSSFMSKLGLRSKGKKL